MAVRITDPDDQNGWSMTYNIVLSNKMGGREYFCELSAAQTLTGRLSARGM